ncbi:PAS domain S-box protein [Candidatus Chlorohelix sp.]|uniref:PAS domain S-box protein n=1 Tax=Candidatus Chlorohelix sp. TaxID=3139201 RepID=UPI00305DF470
MDNDVSPLQLTETGQQFNPTNPQPQSFNNAFFALNPDWTISYIDHQATPLFSKERAQLVGKNIWEECPDLAKTAAFTLFHKAVETGEPLSFEFQHPHLVTWFQFHLYPSQEGLSIYIHSIIELAKQAEEILSQFGQRFAKIFQTNPVAMAISTISDGRYWEVNESALKLVGYTREEMIGRTSVELGIWFDKNEREVMLQLMQAQGYVRGFEIKVQSSKGEIIHCLAYAEIIELDSEKYLLTMMSDITKRKQAEEALYASEARFKVIFEHAAVGIAVLRLADYSTYANPHLCEILGYSAEELSKMPYASYTYPKDFPAESKLVSRMLAGEIPNFTYQKRYVRKDGSLIWANTSFSITRNPDGSPNLIIGVIEDITTHKEAEKALRESEERFKIIFEQAAVGIILIQLDKHFAAANPRLCEMLGYTAEELSKMRTIDYTYPEDLPVERQLGEQMLAGEIPHFTYQKRYVRKDGSLLWANLSVSTTRNPDGKPKLIIGIVEDITALKQAQEELNRQQERRYNLLAENISDMVLVMNMMGKYSYISPSSKEVVGYAPEELIGQYSLDFTHPDDLHKAFDALKVSREQFNRYDSVLTRFRHKEGHYIWLEGTGQTRFSEETGEPIDFVGSLRDVTQRIVMETALRESEQRYRLLAENTVDVVIALSKKGKYLYASPSCERVVGYTSEELGRTWGKDLVHPHDIQLINVSVPSNRALENPYEPIVVRVRHKQGHYIWVEIDRVTAYSEETGEADSQIITWHDITARKKAENELYYRYEFEKLVANISSKLLMVNFESIDAEINQALAVIVQFLSLDRCQIYYYSDDLNYIIRAYECCKEGVPLLGKNNNVPVDLWAKALLKKGEAIRLNSLADLPPEANSFQALLEKGAIQSMVQLPLIIEQEVIGFISFETVTQQNAWSDNDMVLLKIVAEVFTSAFKHQKTKRDLIEQRDFAQLVMDNLGQGLSISWRESALGYVNPALTKLTGYSAQEMTGKSPLDFTHPDYRQKVREARWQWFNGNTATTESIILTKDGSEKYVSITGTPFYNNGELTGVITVLTDLTERRKTEEALRNSEQLLRTVVSNAPLILFAIDANGTITFVDGKALSYFNIEPQKIVGQNIRDLKVCIGDYVLNKIKGAIELALGGEVVHGIANIGERYFEGVYTPISDKEGRVSGIIGLISNITERIVAEEKLAKSLEIEQELNNQKSLFIATASHQFRTPLTIINSSTELLEYYGHKWTEEHKQEIFQRIYLAVSNMTELMEDVMLLNRSGTGKMEYHPINMDFSQLCAKILEEIKMNPDTNRQFDLHIEPAPVTIQGDPKLIRHIISNLVNNSIKYSAEGSTVHFRLGYAANKVWVEVKDEGIGIPPEDLNHLFDAFYRAKNATNFEGSGLGMTIVKKCLEAHNGKIEIESELNKGTLCRVELPLEQPQA